MMNGSASRRLIRENRKIAKQGRKKDRQVCLLTTETPDYLAPAAFTFSAYEVSSKRQGPGTPGIARLSARAVTQGV